MSGRKELSGLLARLRSDDAHSRDLAAAYLGDWLETNPSDGRKFQSVVHALIQAALAESDPVAKESMFNTLSTAAVAPNAREIDWQPLVASLNELTSDCLEHALVILGFSGKSEYRTQVEPFRRHSEEDVRQAAIEALQMLDGKKPTATAKVSRPGRTHLR